MRRQKPTVKTRCVANTYVGKSERIIEFSFANGSGGLISFKEPTHGDTRSLQPQPAQVHVYRVDAGIAVSYDVHGHSAGTRGEARTK